VILQFVLERSVKQLVAECSNPSDHRLNQRSANQHLNNEGEKVTLYESYEEAIDIALQGDGLCDITVTKLNGYMVSDAAQKDSERPLWPFDMQFLFVSIARFLGAHIGHQFKITLPELQKIKMANIPDLSTGLWPSYDFVSLGFASKYVEYMHHLQVPDGKLFDVNVALHLACMAFARDDFANMSLRIEAIEQLPKGHVYW
jgi:hypothetical protein